MAEAAREGVSRARTVTVRSQRFGTYDVPEDRILDFSDGLIGFPHCRRFALLEPQRDGSPFRYMLCVDWPELGFVVCDPEAFCPGYTGEVPQPAELGADVGVLAIVTVPAEPRAMTANLVAPLVVDCATRVGRQLVLDSARFSTRHRLLPAAADGTAAADAGAEPPAAGVATGRP
jgi:flagellar assembly factor FliW